MDRWPEDKKTVFLGLAEAVPGPFTGRLALIADDLGVYICAGMLERAGHRHFNTQVMVAPGQGLLGRYRKVQVAHQEAWFSQPGDEFPMFDIKGVPTGILIFRDKSFPEIARILALEGALLLLNPHSSAGSGQGPFTDWQIKLCTARAMENGCFLIANNNVFEHTIDRDEQGGHSFAIDPFGELIAHSKGPADLENMLIVEIDTEEVRKRREGEGVHFNLWSRLPAAYQRIVAKETPGPPAK